MRIHTMKLHLCRDCLRTYKRSPEGKKAKKAGGAWGRGKWPSSLYCDSSRRLCQQHRGMAVAAAAKRHSAELQRTPAWANHAAIRAVYQEAARLALETGIPHDVDHVVPLRGRLVSGLHVHNNLRPLPAKENRAKNNKFEVG